MKVMRVNARNNEAITVNDQALEDVERSLSIKEPQYVNKRKDTKTSRLG